MSSNVYNTVVWKIENVSRSPDRGRMSPTLTPARGLELDLELIFEKGFRGMSMKVAISCCKKPKSIQRIHGKITCTSSTSRKCHLHDNAFKLSQKEKQCSVRVFRSLSLKLPDKIEDVFNLPDDVIIMEVALAISSQGLVYVGAATTQDTCKQLMADFGEMYKSKCNADIKFTFRGGIDLPAHRLILSARSPVFRRMFESDMLEKDADAVPIQDFGAVAFDLFLAFLYSGELADDVGFEDLCSLYSAADKYDVTTLWTLCSSRMCSLMTVENVAAVLHLANLHKDSEAKQAVKNFIHENL